MEALEKLPATASPLGTGKLTTDGVIKTDDSFVSANTREGEIPSSLGSTELPIGIYIVLGDLPYHAYVEQFCLVNELHGRPTLVE